MRLGKHLVLKEEGGFLPEISDFVKDIEKECSDIVYVYKKENRYFYRGVKYGFGGQICGERIPRTERAPKDTPMEIHNELDIQFKRKFGWRARSEGVFVTPNRLEASAYGKPAIIFPVDGFKYLWAPEIEDLYSNRIEGYYSDNADEDDAYEKYNEEYGHETGNGVWEDEESGEQYQEYDDVEGFIRKLYLHDPDMIETSVEILIENEDGEKEERLLFWRPSMDFDSFFQDYIENERDFNLEKDIREWVSEYKNTNIESALNHSNEVMIKCKKYYWLDCVYMHMFEKLFKARKY